jgi:hypothetical protein
VKVCGSVWKCVEVCGGVRLVPVCSASVQFGSEICAFMCVFVSVCSASVKFLEVRSVRSCVSVCLCLCAAQV